MNQIDFSNIKLYISIDFSLESTGVTFFDTVKNDYRFLSFINCVERKTEERVDFLVKSLKDKDYSAKKFYRDPIMQVKNRADGLYGWEKEHISNVLYYGDTLCKEIKNIIKKYYNVGKENICVLIENYSYSSMSDTLIQLVENTMSLKKELLKSVVDINNFYCIPAPRVKQYVGKGNYDKFQMVSAFVDNIKEDENLKKSSFHKVVGENLREKFLKERIKKGKPFNEILSPLSDVVDSYWILKFFIDVPIGKQIGR